MPFLDEAGHNWDAAEFADPAPAARRAISPLSALPALGFDSRSSRLVPKSRHTWFTPAVPCSTSARAYRARGPLAGRRNPSTFLKVGSPVLSCPAVALAWLPVFPVHALVC